MLSVHEVAQGKWDSILAEFGVPTNVRKNQPCPVCGGKDRFRYVGNEYGKWVCTHCTGSKYKGGLDLALLLDGGPFAEVARRVEELAGVTIEAKPVQKTDPAIRLRETWKKTGPLRREVIAYLDSRGLQPHKALRQAELPFYDDGKLVGVFPSMVALVEDQRGPISLHTTYLLPDGKVRKMLPPIRPATACFVRMGEPGPIMGVAEGIETALAVDAKYPVWPALNAGSLERFTPPDGVTHLHIWGDCDKSYTGQAAAYGLAKRVVASVSVSVHIPKFGDWADKENRNGK